jgi:hypothetical protein
LTRDERDQIIQKCAAVAYGFAGATNSRRLKRFAEAGLILAVYKRDREIGEAIEALMEEPVD